MHPLTSRALVAASLALLAATGCGSDDDDGATATTSSTTEAPDPSQVEVTAVDYGYSGLPEEIAAGTRIVLANASSEELHELVALRLTDGEDRSIEELVSLPQAELEALFSGPPALVAVAPPEADGFAAVGDGSLAEPGRYVVMCFIPTGADPQAYLDALEANPGQPPQVDGGPPHFTRGMYQELTVR